MNGVIYGIRNLTNNVVYIGSTINYTIRRIRHKYELKRNKHHCIHLQRAWNKYGERNFSFEILMDNIPPSELKLTEQYILDTTHHQLYNTSLTASGGDTISNHPLKNLIIERRSITFRNTINQMSNEERKARWARKGERNGMWGKTHSDENKKKQSERAKRYYEKNGSIRKGKTNVELLGEERAAIISKQLSDYGKQRVGEKNPFFGRTHTDEFKKISSFRTKQRWLDMTVAEKKQALDQVGAKPVVADGQEFESLTVAAKYFNITPAALLNRIRSNNFPNFYYKLDSHI